MNHPPREIDGASVIAFTPIDQRHSPTGACRHFVGGKTCGPAAGLAICRYAADNSIYLFGCNDNWSSITDTCHESLAEAMGQAEFEYRGITQTWQRHA